MPLFCSILLLKKLFFIYAGRIIGYFVWHWYNHDKTIDLIKVYDIYRQWIELHIRFCVVVFLAILYMNHQ